MFIVIIPSCVGLPRFFVFFVGMDEPATRCDDHAPQNREVGVAYIYAGPALQSREFRMRTQANASLNLVYSLTGDSGSSK